MATAETYDGSVTAARLLRWVGPALLLLVASLFVTRVGETLTRPRTLVPVAIQAGMIADHCAQFIAVAKTAYGADWKQRLDPRDTTCAAEVQQHWQAEWSGREPVQPLPSGTMRVKQPTPPPTMAIDELPPPAMTINESALPVLGNDDPTLRAAMKARERKDRTDKPRGPNTEASCLNAISLARSRSGADWRSQVSAQEAASCGGSSGR
jgi:hypothetical protein